MKIKTYHIVILFSILQCQLSCKDYLDLKGDNTVIVPVSLDDFQALLNNTATMNRLATPSLIEDWADDYFVLPSRFETYQPGFQKLYTWKIEIMNHPNDWSTCYQPVYYSNFCLEGLSKVERTATNQVQYDRVHGASLFFSSYYYLKLLWAFAPAYDENTADTDLGIVLKEDTDFNTPSVRSSVAEGYRKLIEDTEEAISLLPAVADIPTQPSKLTGHALLARTYLSMRDYEKALFHAQEALKISDVLMDYNKVEDGVNPALPVPFQKYNKETIFYTEMNGYQGGFFTNSTGGRIDTVLFDRYEKNDLRKQLYFIESEGYNQYRASYSGTNYIYFSGLAFDELYLIAAESKARLNDVSGAMRDLNYLLKHRYDNSEPFEEKIVADQTEALNTILLERRKSLIFRGLRLMDIKRLNKEGRDIAIKRNIDGKEYVLSANDPRFVLPLPDDLRPFVQ